MIIVVDSDNILYAPIIREFLKYILKSGHVFAGILNMDAHGNSSRPFLSRSRYVDELKVGGFKAGIYEYEAFRRQLKGTPPFFYGPKQAVIIKSRFIIDEDILSGIEYALKRVPPMLRNCISDETVLGLYAYLCSRLKGVEKACRILWTIGSYHMRGHRGGFVLNEALVAYAHYRLASALSRRFGIWNLRGLL